MRRLKYSNVKTTVDGIQFDSKREANRYGELKLMLKAGEISGLVLQPRFVLQESFRDDRWGTTKDGKPKMVPSVVYNADFQYEQNGSVVVEDVKGQATKGEMYYRLKKRLFLARYKDVDFREV